MPTIILFANKIPFFIYARRKIDHLTNELTLKTSNSIYSNLNDNSGWPATIKCYRTLILFQTNTKGWLKIEDNPSKIISTTETAKSCKERFSIDYRTQKPWSKRYCVIRFNQTNAPINSKLQHPPPGHTPGIWLCIVPGEGGIWTLRLKGGQFEPDLSLVLM